MITIDHKLFNSLRLPFLLIPMAFAQAYTPAPATLVSDTLLPIIINGKQCGNISLKAGTSIFIKELGQDGVIVSQGIDPSSPTFKVESKAVDPKALIKFQSSVPVAQPTPSSTALSTITPSPSIGITAAGASKSSSNQTLWEQGKAPQISPGSGLTLRCPDSLTSAIFKPDQNKESFFIFIPKSYTKNDPTTKYGLVVFISAKSDDEKELPRGWAEVLNSHNLFFVAPQKVDNHSLNNRREGMSLLSVDLMLKYFPNIDKSRVYAAGISGGSRIAGQLGFHYPRIFHGTIQSCGSDFYEQVPHLVVTQEELKKNESRDKDGPYGICTCANPQESKASAKFVLITGPKDFRHNYILDIYNGGFLKQGFRCKLLDIPTMGHEICSGDTLQQALSYIEE